MSTEEPLEYLSRKELLFNVMKNIDREIQRLPKRNNLRYWWSNTPNWVKVQTFINGNTKKSGSTSSAIQCIFIGINPDEKFIPEEMEP